jgi:ribosomal protein RSM22 (predicted rRNA methylase)
VQILVEPGTPVGFHNIKLARSTVLGDLSHGLPNVLAPVPLLLPRPHTHTHTHTHYRTRAPVS